MYVVREAGVHSWFSAEEKNNKGATFVYAD